MSLSRRQEWVLRISLALGGLAVAVVCCVIGYYIVRQRAAASGAEFATLQDLRQSLATADARLQSEAGSGPLKLGAIIQAHPDDQLIYDLKPNLSVTFQGAPVRTNSCGMREREILLPKPANTYRIAVIGDSFTFGWGVTEEEAFPRQLEEVLNTIVARAAPTPAAGRPTRVEVLNFGVPGYSPFQEVATFETKALQFNPDAVILFFIENDFGMPFFIRDLEQPQNLFASANLQSIARAALAGGEEASKRPRAPQLPAEFDPNRALQKLARIADTHGIKTYLAINPKNNWRSLHSRLWVLKKTHQIKFMNIFPEFERMIEVREYPKESLTLQHDQHPSPRKHRMLAEVMAPYFLDSLL